MDASYNVYNMPNQYSYVRYSTFVMKDFPLYKYRQIWPDPDLFFNMTDPYPGKDKNTDNVYM